MTRYLFETDLTAMKFAILQSTRHDRVIRSLATLLDVPVQPFRRCLIGHLDMILLENLPARFEEGTRLGDPGDPVGKAFGRELLSRYIPLVESRLMDEIYQGVRQRISEGMAAERAISEGHQVIREALFRELALMEAGGR